MKHDRVRDPSEFLLGKPPGVFIAALTIALFLLGIVTSWELLSHTSKLIQDFFSAPTNVFFVMVNLFETSNDVSQYRLDVHVWASLKRVLVPLVVGTMIGFPLGVALPLFSRMNGIVIFGLGLWYAMSKVSVFYILIVWFGIGEEPKLIFNFYITMLFQVLMGFWQSYNFLHGTRRLDSSQKELLYQLASMGANRLQSYWYVLLPLSLPKLFWGLFLSSSLIWSLLPLSETGTAKGLGYLVSLGHEIAEVDLIFASTLILALCNVVMCGLIRTAEVHILRWKS